MPSYNVTFTDGERNLRDEGVELTDDAAARDFAVGAARELLAQRVQGNDWTRWRMEVEDETGRVVLAMSLSEIAPAKRAEHAPARPSRHAHNS